jgi:hypothetical protein
MASVMLAPSLSASHAAPIPPAIIATALPAPSCGASSAGIPVDLHRYRTVFPHRWAELLNRHFNGDLRRVMFFFDVSERTARDWLAGMTGPNGSAAIIAASRIPGAIEHLMAAA